MERRQFIESASVAIASFFVSPLLGSCTQKRSIQLNHIIGEQEKIIQTFPHQGDDKFSFYVLEIGSFDHSDIKGDKAYLYCENGKIVGYTITSKNIEESQKWQEFTTAKFGVAKLDYENNYGFSQHWQKGNRKITLSTSGNQENNIQKKTFYSEVISSSNIMI